MSSSCTACWDDVIINGFSVFSWFFFFFFGVIRSQNVDRISCCRKAGSLACVEEGKLEGKVTETLVQFYTIFVWRSLKKKEM